VLLYFYLAHKQQKIVSAPTKKQRLTRVFCGVYGTKWEPILY